MKNIVIITVVIALALGSAFYLDLLPWFPNQDGKSGIDIYLISEDGVELEKINDYSIYSLTIDSQESKLFWEGREISGVGYSLWVKPTKTVSSAYIGEPYLDVEINFEGYRSINGNQYAAATGKRDIPWNRYTELIDDKLSDSWIQVTKSSLAILDVPEGQTKIEVWYNVHAVGYIDGKSVESSATPRVSSILKWTPIEKVTGVKEWALSLETKVIDQPIDWTEPINPYIR